MLVDHGLEKGRQGFDGLIARMVVDVDGEVKELGKNVVVDGKTFTYRIWRRGSPQQRIDFVYSQPKTSANDTGCTIKCNIIQVLQYDSYQIPNLL